MQKYVFRRYVPEYVTFFALEKRRLRKALGPFAKIQHVGSTAIVGLGGKGILDVLVGVPKAKFKEAKKKLEKARYEFREMASTPERLFFRKDYGHSQKKRRVHIHLTTFGNQDWGEMVGFRDFLLQHPDMVKEYVKRKKEAVKKARGIGELYRKHKESFIKNIVKKALQQ